MLRLMLLLVSLVLAVPSMAQSEDGDAKTAAEKHLNAEFAAALKDDALVTIKDCVVRILRQFDQCRSADDEIGSQQWETILDVGELRPRMSYRRSVLAPNSAILEYEERTSLADIFRMAREVEGAAVMAFNSPDQDFQLSHVSEASELFLVENGIKSRHHVTGCNGATWSFVPSQTDLILRVTSEAGGLAVREAMEHYSTRFCTAP